MGMWDALNDAMKGQEQLKAGDKAKAMREAQERLNKRVQGSEGFKRNMKMMNEDDEEEEDDRTKKYEKALKIK